MSDEQAAPGVDHLQAAALEMIGAARAFLDAVEEMVGDREKVASVVEAVGSVAQDVARGARLAASQRRAADRDDPDDPFSGPVEHIRVS